MRSRELGRSRSRLRCRWGCRRVRRPRGEGRELFLLIRARSGNRRLGLLLYRDRSHRVHCRRDRARLNRRWVRRFLDRNLRRRRDQNQNSNRKLSLRSRSQSLRRHRCRIHCRCHFRFLAVAVTIFTAIAVTRTTTSARTFAAAATFAAFGGYDQLQQALGVRE